MNKNHVKIGDHNLLDVPKNTEGIIIKTYTTTAYNERKRPCGVHYYYVVRIGNEEYSIPTHATNRPIKDV
jgi:hypothetical protein